MAHSTQAAIASSLLCPVERVFAGQPECGESDRAIIPVCAFLGCCHGGYPCAYAS